MEKYLKMKETITRKVIVLTSHPDDKSLGMSMLKNYADH